MAAPLEVSSPTAGWSAELRGQVRLAVPLALVSAGQQLMSVVDTAVVGRLGAAELGAVGLGNALWGFVLITLMGTLWGMDPLISQALGAGERAAARARAWQGVHLGTALGCVGMLAVGVAPLLVAPFQADAAMADLTRQYLWWRAPSLVPALWFVVARSWLQACGITRPMVLGMVVANVLNAVLAQLLVHGGAAFPVGASALGWVPALGVGGAAVATMGSTLVQWLMVMPAVRRTGQGLVVSRAPNAAQMRHALHVGFPLSVQMGAEVGLFSLVGVMAGALGRVDMAAHQVALQVASLSFTVSLGVGSAGCVRVGHAVGSGDVMAVRRNGGVALGMGLGWMACMAGLLALFPGQAARLLTDQEDVVAAAIPLLRVAALFQLSDGLQAVGAGVLRGAADTRFLSVANVVGHYGVGLPVALGAAYGLGRGITGLWWGLCAGLSTVALALVVRFERLSRTRIQRA